MQHLEVSGAVVLYIGRMVSKGLKDDGQPGRAHPQAAGGGEDAQIWRDANILNMQ
jgi:hypothetical protein